MISKKKAAPAKIIRYRDDFWQAAMTGLGGNLIRLRRRENGFDILRHPPRLRDLRADSVVWGLPMLFPPNRTADASFDCAGIHYSLPLNRPSENNHIHGILHHTLWHTSRTANGLRAVRRWRNGNPWPHSFTVTTDYEFTPFELRQSVRFVNDGTTAMPFMFGQHSAFRLPRGSSAAVALGGREIALDPLRHLPTGESRPVAKRIFDSHSGPVSLHAEAAHDPDGFSTAVFTHPSAGLKIIYKTDAQYRFWMLWNAGGRRGMFCAEPQTCAVNAAHSAGTPDAAETGFRMLAPGEEVTLKTSIAVCRA